MQLPILKRVIVRGVARSQRDEAENDITIAWLMDLRFTRDNESPNTWAAIELDDDGTRSEGPRQPFAGAGGFARVSRLAELPDACLVELRMVLHEPRDWFRGDHVLRSKIPILMQESARRFRRRVME